MRQTLAALAAAAIVAAPLAAAHASGPVRMRVIARNVASPVVSDGSRWAAYEPRAGITTLIDVAQAPLTAAG